jgi:hypothetical protein
MKPQRLQLDFVHRGATAPAWAWLLCAAASVACAGLWWQGSRLRAEADTLAAAQARAAPAPAGDALRRLDAPTQARLARELLQAQQVAASLNLPWAALFARLEALKVPQVSLLSLQPEAATARRIRITAEARRLEDALDYVAQAAATPGLANVHLVSHETAAEGERAVLRFALTLDWVGAQP